MTTGHSKDIKLMRQRLCQAPRLAIAMGVILALVLALILKPTLTRATEEGLPVSELRVRVEAPLCGQSSLEAPPSIMVSPSNSASLAQPASWVTLPDENDTDVPTPLDDTFVGGKTYSCLLTLSTKTGHVFEKDTALFVYDDGLHEYRLAYPLQLSETSMTIVVSVTAKHDWDENRSWHKIATCTSEGMEHRECRADPSHVEETVIAISPDAHEWGEWEITKEQTKKKDGEMQRTCSLCGEVETQTIPRTLYANVYEPDTSWPMAATVAWRADQSALDVASAKTRPATAFVWLDKNLGVHDRDGELIAKDLESYVSDTALNVIPALYIKDAATASALKEWLREGKLLDCFVVSTPGNQKLVASVADLLHVRGMLDYTSITSPTHQDLLDMVSSTNAAHGKVILLCAEAATYENVRLLQKLGSTVWVQTPTDARSLLTLYTNGVNGVVVDDYTKALDAEELFDDDAPSLLRIPFIISHRGDPSTYVENTLDSALGAYVEGADGVENDIHLTTDGELFIYHDDYADGLMGLANVDENGEPVSLESLTLDEVRSYVFPWDSILESNRVSKDWWRYDTLYGQNERKEYVVPTLREYIEVFRGTPLIHVTEIKSRNPEILPRYKLLVDEYDAWDQFVSITFVRDILDAAYQNYPELSIGALATEDNGSYRLESLDYDDLAKEKGTEAALQQLMSRLDQWNATYNPIKKNYGSDVVQAARHRGLTVWPWTYSLRSADVFARDYLAGMTGVTGDHSWVASDLIVRIESQDITVDSLSSVPKPRATTQSKRHLWLDDAELIQIEEPSDDQVLAMWRYEADLLLNGTSYGSYYLYSNPFVITLSTQDEESHAHEWDAWVVSEPATSTTEGRESRQCKICGEVQTRSVPTTTGEDDTSTPTEPKVPAQTVFDHAVDGEVVNLSLDGEGASASRNRGNVLGGGLSIALFVGIAVAIFMLLGSTKPRKKRSSHRDYKAKHSARHSKK